MSTKPREDPRWLAFARHGCSSMPLIKDAVQATAVEFNAEINAAYGLYLDAISGFSALVDVIDRSQRESGAPDDTPFFYGSGNPNHPEHSLLHQTTHGILRARIQKGGGNYFLLARLLIVLLYELWEAGYRERLASAAGVSRDTLTLPIFGDLRHLRNEILHNKGRLSRQTAEKLEVLKAPPTGLVDYNDTDVQGLVRLVKMGLDDLVTRWTGEDPEYRRVWRLT